eukprot:TRINITY_DN3293_c3_g2_i3.p3 TRINITY_DN3293_c3_g2~~TRINITY_DN3293_c3_g2_i3.p3  ORF type:complete len:53 (+),score=5.89 TRINITY_DN3293_c3_g2_i3:52-210(+)
MFFFKQRVINFEDQSFVWSYFQKEKFVKLVFLKNHIKCNKSKSIKAMCYPLN